MQGEKKERFNAMQQEMSQLSTKFSNNVLDSTKGFKKLVTDAAQLEGVPPSAMSLFAQQAKSEGYEDATAEKGPWLLTLVRRLTHCLYMQIFSLKSMSGASPPHLC